MDEILIKLIGVLIGLLLAAAYFQNLWTSIQEDIFFLFITGAIIPPLGMIYGIGIWLGIWP